MSKYDELTTIVHNARFFSTSVENMGDWDRIVVANKRMERGFGGNSFWITLIDGKWYLGTWGGLEYRAEDFQLLCEFVIQNLTEHAATVSSFDLEVCSRFKISLLDDEEFDRIAGETYRSDLTEFDLARSMSSFQVGERTFDAEEWCEGKIVSLAGDQKVSLVGFELSGEVIAMDKFDRISISTHRLNELLDEFRKEQ